MRKISETVSDVLETWAGQNIFSLKWQKKKKKKKKKKTYPHKESRAKKEEKGKENFQDMCKNCRACNRKKRGGGGIWQIYYLWVTVITPDMCKILQEKPNGKLKMVLFRMKK